MATKNIIPLQDKLPVKEQRRGENLREEEAELFYRVSATQQAIYQPVIPALACLKAIHQIIAKDPNHPSSRLR